MVLRQGISFLISWVGSCLTRTRGYLRYPTGKHRGRESKQYCILYPVSILADQSIYNIEALENLATSFRVIRRPVPCLG